MTEQATPKQIEFAKKLGIKAPWEYSKDDLRTKIQAVLEQQSTNGDSKPLAVPQKVVQKGSVKEFHLSPEQVNTNALMAAIEWAKTMTINEKINLLEIATKFKEFIENGN